MKDSLSKRLHAVDPKLKIVPGGMRHKKAERPPAQFDLCTGIICKICGREVFRSRDGMCLPCWNTANEFQVIDKTGWVEMMPKTVLEQITHQSKKER